MLTYDDIEKAINPVKLAKAAIADSRTIKPARPADAYLPTSQRLQQLIEAGSVDPKELIRSMREPIVLGWGTRRLADFDALATARQHHLAMRSMAPPEQFKRKYTELTRRLALDQSIPAAGGSVAVRDLVEASGASFEAMLDRVTDTAEHARFAVEALRAFDDVVIRVRAARRAADATGQPIGDVMALYREEGDLCVFPSHGSIALGVPSGTSTEGTLIFGAHRPDFSHLVWLADPDRATVEANGLEFKRYALCTAFFIQPIGADHIAGRVGPRIVEDFAEWSAQNWIASGIVDGADLAARKADATERWNTLEAGLVLERTRGHTGSEPEILKIAPESSEVLLAGVLAEGIAFFRALGNADNLMGRPTAQKLGPTLQAIRYNAQATPRLVPALIVSAILSATSGSGEERLKAAVKSPDLRPFLRSTREAMAKTADDEWAQVEAASHVVGGERVLVDELATWLLAETPRPGSTQADRHIDLLDRFIHTARTDRWSGYQGGKPGEKNHGGMRSYGWHSRLLRDFFGRVFSS
jgi:hypothetical protein